MPSMTAVRLDTTSGRLDIRTVGVPVPGPSEVRVKVAYAGICLSDIHFIQGEIAAGMLDEVTLGHEVSGTVDMVGSDVAAWAPGDRVVAQPLEDLGTSTRIMGVNYDGAWAEHVVVPAKALVSVPEHIPLAVAAIVPDAISTPWAAITDTARVRATESVAVWGLGGLGYHAVKLLRLVGAAPIIAVDPLEAARQRALDAGADVVLDPRAEDFHEQLMGATDGVGIDVAFDFFGAASIHQQSFDALARNGRLVLVGIPEAPLHIDATNLVVRRSNRILGHYGQSARHSVELMKLIGLGRVDFTDSVTDVYDLADAHEAVGQLTSKSGNPIRILLRP